MARDGRSSGRRGGLAGFIDRLLGREQDERATSASTALFTAHQPPPPLRPDVEDRPPADGTVIRAPSAAPSPEAPEVEPDLFRSYRPHRDAWEELSTETVTPPPPPTPEPEARPEPPIPPEPEVAPEPEVPSRAREEEELHTAVHEEALDQVNPRTRSAPGVRVHDDHLERRSGPVELTPSQAIELARGGRDTLRRRDRS